VREFLDLPGDKFQRNVLLARREEVDAQAVISKGLDLLPERRVRRTLAGC